MLKENSDWKQTLNTQRKTLKIVPYTAGLRRFELRMRMARVPVWWQLCAVAVAKGRRKSHDGGLFFISFIRS